MELGPTGHHRCRAWPLSTQTPSFTVMVCLILVNFCWGLGQVVCNGVIRSMLPRTDQWAYRIPYALQWMWPVPLLIGVVLASESSWWLVRRGRLEDAKHALLRLTSLDHETDFDADETIAMMRHTRRRLQGAIVCIVSAMQNLAGNSFASYSTYFLEQAGLAPAKPCDFALGQYGIHMAGVFGVWALIACGG
ncbi:general substrate transporter [Mycena epipterygia]|nr:general substrate transporter [Mycena epipterygia]